MSGYSNPVYQKGHVKGDAHLVISNLFRLRYHMDRAGTTFPVHIFYHVYNDNCGEELLNVAKLATELGFEFRPGWAYLMGLEKVLSYVHGEDKFTPEDRELLDRLVLSLDEAIAISKTAQSARCYLQEHQTVINHDGSVALCCTVYDPAYWIGESFLELTNEEIASRKHAADLCNDCMSNSLHDYAMYNPNNLWDRACQDVQELMGQEYVTAMFSAPPIRERATQPKDTLFSNLFRSMFRPSKAKS